MMNKTFHIFPAIDLRSGQVVRLKEGDPEQQTHYSSQPAVITRQWLEAGASWLHVINLDGAFGANSKSNIEALSDILLTAKKSNVKVQFGGGLRNLEDIAAVMDMGVERAILGTAAIKEPGILRKAMQRWGEERIAVSLDARGDEVQIHGWQESSRLNLFELAAKYESDGLKWLVYTDIARDGMQTGYNQENTRRLARQTSLQVIASGGVRAMEDISTAKSHKLSGIIVGKALYEGSIDLKQAVRDYQVL